MKRLAAAVVLLAVACSGGGTRPPDSWANTAATLTDTIEPTASNVCSRGAPSCLDIIVAEMTRRLDAHAAACDHRALFDLAYLAVTRGLRDTEQTDPSRAASSYLRHLDAVFARLDFTADDALTGGHADATPRVWQIAFDAAEGRSVTGIGDLLLGMNAHISRDLAFAVATVGVKLPDQTSAKAAFDKVNVVIGNVQQSMLADESRRFDPTLSAFDVSQITPAAKSVGDLFTAWRDEAWANALRLTAATDAERPQVAASIDADAAARSQAILAATHYIPLMTSSSSRDQYCAAHGRS